MPLILGITTPPSLSLHWSPLCMCFLIWTLFHSSNSAGCFSLTALPLKWSWCQSADKASQNLLHICSVFPLTPEPNDNMCFIWSFSHLHLFGVLPNFGVWRKWFPAFEISTFSLEGETCGMTSVWAPARSQWKSDNLNQQNHCGNTPFC